MNRDAFDKFENWAIPRCLHLSRRPDGEYASVTTQEAWEAWQAALEEAAQAIRKRFENPASFACHETAKEAERVVRALAQGGT